MELAGRTHQLAQVQQVLRSGRTSVVLVGASGSGLTAMLKASQRQISPRMRRSFNIVDDLATDPRAEMIFDDACAGRKRLLGVLDVHSVESPRFARWIRSEHVALIELPPLNRSDLVALATDLLGEPLDETSADRLVALSQGLPKIAALVLEVLREHDRLRSLPGGLLAMELGLPHDERLDAWANEQLQGLELLIIDDLAACGPLPLLDVGDSWKTDTAMRAGLVKVAYEGSRTRISLASMLLSEILQSHWSDSELACRRAECLRRLLAVGGDMRLFGFQRGVIVASRGQSGLPA